MKNLVANEFKNVEDGVSFFIKDKVNISQNLPVKNEINELESFLKKTDLPDEIKLSECEKIFNVKKFIEVNLRIVKNNNKNIIPYLDRLKLLKTKL